MVDIDAHRRIDAKRAFVEADTTESVDRRVGRTRSKAKAGYRRGDVLKRGDVPFGKLIAAQSGDRRTHVIEILFALVRRYHDLVGRRRLALLRKNRRRSEARRVGKECVSKCRSRWSPEH